mmetsp:Transcript_33692/g.54083  ORF Transcript_33692/g.54083 Transcript_33692/m.54083 type:complete len:214 (+) Transcript_33692:1483-2124(+)
MAASFAFQLLAGSAAYWPNSAVTYPLTDAVMTSGNFAVSPLTSSHAPRRLVSESEPSMSRRIYSTWFDWKSSSSSSRNCRLGMTMDSHTWRSVSPPANSEKCTEFATVVRNRTPDVTRWSLLGSIPVLVRRVQTSPTKVCRKRWNSSSFFSMYRLILSQMAALTWSTTPAFSRSRLSSAASAGLSYAKYTWNSPIHASMLSSNTSGSSWLFRL